MLRDQEVTTHPSYGCIQVSRVTGGGPLFGTYINHNERMVLRISEAEHIRSDLGYDRTFATKRLIEIELSPEQWVEAITNPNCGMGTPCTIRIVGGEQREPPPETINIHKRSEKEFAEELQQLSQQLAEKVAEAEGILDKKTALNREEKSVVRKALSLVQSHLVDSLPFIREMFTRELDKSVTEAKVQIETAAIQTSLRQGELAKEIVNRAVEMGLEVHLPDVKSVPRIEQSED